MNPKDILISVTTDYETDVEMMVDLTRNLRGDVLTTEVEDARVAEGDLPPQGSKTLNAFDWNTLVVSLIGAGGVVTSLLTILNSWMQRNQGTKLLMVLPNGAKLTLEGNLLLREDFDKFINLIERSLEAEDKTLDPLDLPTNTRTSDLISLREKMLSFLSLGEIKAICFDLAIDYEALSGENKSEKVISLLLHCERRDCITSLQEACAAQNAAIDWTT